MPPSKKSLSKNKKDKTMARYPTPKAFRLTDADIDTLRNLTEILIKKTNAKIKHTQVLRALIYLGKNLPAQDIINQIKDLSV